MKAVLLCIGVVVSAASRAEVPALNCDQGPANRIFGGTPWLVYGCSDKHSVVVVAAKGSPAMPFYFMFTYGSETYHLYGEGAGNRAKTDQAYAELSKLTKGEIERLYVEVISPSRMQ